MHNFHLEAFIIEFRHTWLLRFLPSPCFPTFIILQQHCCSSLEQGSSVVFSVVKECLVCKFCSELCKCCVKLTSVTFAVIFLSLKMTFSTVLKCGFVLFSDCTLADAPEVDGRFQLEKENVLKVTFHQFFTFGDVNSVSFLWCPWLGCS